MIQHDTWLELSSEVAQDQVEWLSDVLLALGALSVRCESATNTALFRESLDDASMWQMTRVIALLAAECAVEPLIEQIHQMSAGSTIEFVVTSVADQDWVRLTQEQFQPQLIANRLWICPTGKQVHDDHLVLHIDPGLAFGTGTHPTTRLCLQWLCENDVQGKQVIDYGCGSGILSIAALILGAQEVYATDHDEQALLATKANAVLNQLGSKLHVQPSQDFHSSPVAIVLANILANPLKKLMPVFANLLIEAGVLVLSGLLEEDVAAIREVYQRCFEEVSVSVSEGWVRMVWLKKHVDQFS